MENGAPSAVHAETVILGSMLLEESAINDAFDVLGVDDFFLDSHRKIFRVMMDLVETGNPVDYTTVVEDLIRRKEIEAVGGRAYVAGLSEGVPRKLNVEAHCKIVKGKSILRGVMTLCNTSGLRAAEQSESPIEILEDLENQIMELSQQTSMRGFRTMLDAMKDAGGFDSYMEKTCDPVALTGLPMGFRDLDDMTGGMKRGELIVVAGRPGSGKTSLAINIATNAVGNDVKAVVAVFSLEMTEASLHSRMLCSVGNVNGQKMQKGFISRDERNSIAGAAHWLADKSIHIDDSASLTPMQMRAKCRRLKQRMGRLDLVEVDYLQLMSPGKKYGNREQEVAAVSRGLKVLAKELDVPVVALAQLSRGSEQRGDKRPMLSDLRESGQIEQDADLVAFIHRQELYEPDNPDVKGLAEVIIAKQRGGSTGVRRLAYIADLTKFSDLHIERGSNNGNSY